MQQQPGCKSGALHTYVQQPYIGLSEAGRTAKEGRVIDINWHVNLAWAAQVQLAE
jgi:hypothetical protein